MLNLKSYFSVILTFIYSLPQTKTNPTQTKTSSAFYELFTNKSIYIYKYIINIINKSFFLNEI